ncbi:MAG: T9SS type A sorting domain-containing protein [Flavobacteriales bacterium]|nr:T9SS type A sorting domain-containing protein [Flavobacteriales bacterium]MCB9168444.1 T9SS type A sorting domain-containing protein [Flavobacteriales bacterium]
MPYRTLFTLCTAALLLNTQAQMVQKCCGSSNSTFLLGNLSTASHSQCIYTPADLTNAQPGAITTLFYRYGTTGVADGNTLTDFMIRLVQTTETAFPNGNTFFTGLDTVLMAASYDIHPGISGDWFAIPLDDTFDYDETLTLVVDISFSGSLTTNFGTMSTSMAGRKLYWNDVTSPTGQSLVSSWQDIGFDLELSTGIHGAEAMGMVLYPNPAQSHMKVLLRGGQGGSDRLSMRDAAGRVVLEAPWPVGAERGTIDVGELAPGCYLVQVTAKGIPVMSARAVIAR